MHEHFRPLEMAQELVPQPEAAMRAFNESRHIGDDEAAIFAEADRTLRDDGVMTVMFTHKRAEAWDTLGMGLMQAGFTIETSWPVNTESEQSLHQAKKNAASTTPFNPAGTRLMHWM